MSDLGITMSQAGSDVAKDASDIILTDENFTSIIHAIEEGRRMFDNIQKCILHLLAENIAQACILLIGPAFKDRRGISVFPLAPVEIIWVCRWDTFTLEVDTLSLRSMLTSHHSIGYHDHQ